MAGTSRIFTPEFKAMVLREAEEGAADAAVIRKYGLTNNAVYEWRGQSAYSGRDKAQELVDGGHVILDRAAAPKAKEPVIRAPSEGAGGGRRLRRRRAFGGRRAPAGSSDSRITRWGALGQSSVGP